MKKLAIAIPNYNRINKLEKLLSEIIKQIYDDDLVGEVQICVSDDCSLEDPTDIVNGLISNNQRIDLRIHRNDTNKGMSINFYESVMMADAQYCWIVGNDDIPEKHGIKNIIDYLDANKDVDFLVTSFDVYGDEGIRDTVYPLYNEIERIYDTRIEEDKTSLLFNVKHNCGVFGFLSNIVFKREIWIDKNVRFNDKMNTLFIQMYINIDKLITGAKYGFSRKKIIRNIADDETNNTIKRIADILIGLDGVTEYFFKNEERKHFKEVLVDPYITGVVWDLPDDNPYKKTLIQIDSLKNTVYKKYFIKSEDRKKKILGKKITIFGAGNFGRNSYNILSAINACIVYFADSDSQKEGELLEGIRIISIDKMIKNYKDDWLVIVANNLHLVEMVKCLEDRGLFNIGIIM